MSACLAIFAKYPMRGRVKTRLSPPLTPEQATDLYRAFLLDTIHLIAHIKDIEPAILFTPDEARDDFRALVPRHFVLVPQRGADFGARLASGFADLFARGCEAAAIMDADSPTLPRAHIVSLFAQLAEPQTDVALGPCEDGGYWAIGLKRLHHAVLTGIPWSTERVLSASLARAAEAGLSAKLAPAWYDVDDGDSLRRLRGELASSGAPIAQHTLRVLARLDAASGQSVSSTLSPNPSLSE
jgi:rSAM/selenodomain-associated transferase 1